MSYINENIPYILIYVVEFFILIKLYKQENRIYLLVFIDIILSILNTFILPIMVENTFLNFNIRKWIYSFSLIIYNISQLFSVICVHIISLSYLTFGTSPKLKSIFKALFILFIIQQSMSTIFLIETWMLFFSVLGIANYIFYTIYKRKKNVSLELKKEILFFLYFIGFSLSFLEHLSIDNYYNYFNTSYNYFIYLLISYLVIQSKEKYLLIVLYSHHFKTALILIIIMFTYIDKDGSLYIPQSAFLILIVSYFIQLNKNSLKFKTN